jgi:cytochrome c oxidase subunit 4
MSEHHHPTRGTYIAVFISLMVLLGVTVLVAEVELGRWNFLAAAVIASIKALLIILFFMHVRYSPPLTWLVSAAGFFWLAILFGLTMADYLTRAFVPLGM